MRPDGTDRHRLGGGISAHANYEWSPDGQWLICSASQPSRSEFAVGLFVVNVASGEVLPLQFGRDLLQPSWRR